MLLRRTVCLVAAASGVALAGCAHDGPPVAVATHATGIADAVQRRLQDGGAAPSPTTDAASAAPTTSVDRPGELDGDVAGGSDGESAGEADGRSAGDVDGEAVGDVNGEAAEDVDGEVPGDANGEVAGDVDGEVAGDVDGEAAEDVDGEAAGDVDGEVAEDVDGDVGDEPVETVAPPTSEPDVPQAQPVEREFDVRRPAMPETAVVIGDSIAKSAEPYVTDVLVRLDVDLLEYDAVVSRRMVNGSSSLPSGRQAIRETVAAGLEPDVWIVALGTNDVASRAGRDAWEVAINELLAEIPPGGDVIWVDTWLTRLDPDATDFNAEVRDELWWRQESWVLDWHARAESDPALITDDGVHLTEAGRLQYAALIGEGLNGIYD